MALLVRPELDLDDLEPLESDAGANPAADAPRLWSGRAGAAAVCGLAGLVLVFAAGVIVGQTVGHHPNRDNTCVVMRFAGAVTEAQIVAIFDAAQGASEQRAEHDGHHASLLFASHANAVTAAAAAQVVAAAQLGTSRAVTVAPWAECLTTASADRAERAGSRRLGVSAPAWS